MVCPYCIPDNRESLNRANPNGTYPPVDGYSILVASSPLVILLCNSMAIGTCCVWKAFSAPLNDNEHTLTAF